VQNNWEPDHSSFVTTEYEEPQEEAPRRSFGRGCLRLVIDLVETLVLALLLYVGINAVAARVRVQGQSMYPTFKGGEFLIVYRFAYHGGKIPHRGDIVVFHPNTYQRIGGTKADYIKRVIGLPGENVRVSGGKVYINGKPLDEPYIAAPMHYSGTWHVPQGKVFVLGDNRNNSTDSHIFGAVPIKYIIGRAVFVYFPPDEIGVLKRINYPDP